MTRTGSVALFAALAAGCAGLPPAVSNVPRTAASVDLRASAIPGIPHADRVRLGEAYTIAERIGDQVWPGWSSAPFATLLVTPEHEYLVRHPRPPREFRLVGYDSLLKSAVLARPRTLALDLLATYPAVAGVPTIVVGQPGATGKSSTGWVLTILHEHFHQLQTSRPGYYAGVEALGLSRGDQTGMWMLNYPFPYDSVPVQALLSTWTRELRGALESGTVDATRARAAAAAASRLREMLSPDDYRYLAFQMWQEGVARYTELAVARLAAARHTPGDDFRALPDYTPFAAAADALEQGIMNGLGAQELARDRRVVFYALGAATALLLDRSAIDWRRRYLDEPFSLDRP